MLRALAASYGTVTRRPCPACGAANSEQLNREQLYDLCHAYFVVGTTPTGRGIFAPQIQFNEETGDFDRFSTESVNADVEMLARNHGIRCFLYGPPLWQFGKPPDEDGAVEWTDNDVDQIIERATASALASDRFIYRVQLNLGDDDFTPSRFCSPPDLIRKFQRFDSASLPVLYAAYDIETALHECRITLQDECYVAVLLAQADLKLLDLSNIETDGRISPFEDPSVWVRSLLFDGQDAYEACRKIAVRAQRVGYDGLIYTSYFQQSAARPHKNVALFGRPICDGKLQVQSYQRVRVSNVLYDWQFGPVVKNAYIGDEEPSSRVE